MDGTRFDGMTRAMAGAMTRRGALGGLAGLVAGAAAQEAGAKKRRCKPACAAGQTCRQGACACDDGGTACGASCCRIGQVCQEGLCAAPPEPICIPFGEGCKDTGRICCDGLVCASGQGGQEDVGCHVRKTGPCTATSECTYGTRCEDGICAGIPQPTPTPAGCTSESECTSKCSTDTTGDCCTALCVAGACGELWDNGNPCGVDGVCDSTLRQCIER